MLKGFKNQKGFGVIEGLLIVLVVLVIGGAGYIVYQKNHTATAPNVSGTSGSTAESNSVQSSQQSSQKYIVISQWGVRVPYQSSDTLTVAGQECYENNDSEGDTVNSGCQITVNSKDLADSVGICTAKVSGLVGYFYRLGPNDNYSYSNGSGYMPIAQWAEQNPGQYTKIGTYYYAFDEIGKATGVSGAAVADTSEMNGTYTGCRTWQAEYRSVEQSVQALADKFETIPN